MTSEATTVDLLETNSDILYMVCGENYYEISGDVQVGATFAELAKIALGELDGDLDGCEVDDEIAEQLGLDDDLRHVASYFDGDTELYCDNIGTMARKALKL